jgi:hypothetical protein
MKTYTIEEIEKVLGKDSAIKMERKIVIGRIKTFEDACNELKMITPVIFSTDCSDLVDKSVLAYAKLCIIAKALNEDWKIDVRDKKQMVWVNWLDLRSMIFGVYAYNGAFAGPVCVNSHNAASDAHTYIGSRLCFKSAELADYCRIQFKDLWIEYLLPEITIKSETK